MIKIATAITQKDYCQARSLFCQYQAWLGIDLSFQAFDTELDSLEQMYGPPFGSLLLARDSDETVGCVGLRDLGNGYCEMKRMFVLPHHQGKGVGSRLLTSFMEAANLLGYKFVRLDSIPRLHEALRLYRKAGFQEIEAYRYNPDPQAVYMQVSVAEWWANRNKNGNKF